MIVNPAGLYGGAAFKVDTTAATNYFLKQQAAEEASKKALEKYYQDQMSKTIGKGLRPQEQLLFDESKKEAQDYFIKNKRAILNGDIKAQAEFQEKMNIPFEISQSSISATDNLKNVYSIVKSSPQIQQRIANKTFGKDQYGQPLKNPATGAYSGIYGAELPTHIRDKATGKIIKNPEYQPFDVSQIQYNPEKMSSTEIDEDFYKTIKNIPKQQETIRTPKDEISEWVVTKKRYSPQALEQVGNEALRHYDNEAINWNWNNNVKFKEYTEKFAKEFEDANKIFQAVFHKPIESPTGDPEENNRNLYAALQLKKAAVEEVSKPEVEVDQLKKAKFEAKERKKLAIFKKSLETKDEYTESHPFDASSMDIPNTKLTIRDGVVYDDKGKPYSSPRGRFDVKIPIGQMDTRVQEKYKKAGVQPELLMDTDVDIQVKNGVIEAVKNEYGTIPRKSFAKKGTSYTQPTPTKQTTQAPKKRRFD